MGVELAPDIPTRRQFRYVAAAAAVYGFVVSAAVLSPGCGGSSSSPTPVSQSSSSTRPSSGPSVNIAPVIESISASSERLEVDEEVTVTAAVKDQETPV